MRFSFQLIAAVAAIPGFVAGHVRMIDPLPFGGLNPTDLSPLDPSGANFPCFVPSSQFVFPPDAPSMSVGPASLTLEGSAVHGGGSCQVSITYDKKPGPNSEYRVLKSFQGGCPIENGVENLGGSAKHTLAFEIPPEVAAGEAVLIWTWFNKVGNREMYMRCAPVNIKSSNTDKSKLSDDAKFPIMFRANIGAVGQNCATPATTDLNFPNPGPNVVGKGNADPTGCSGSAPGGGAGPKPPVKEEPKPVPNPSDEVRKPIAGDGSEDENSEPVIQPPSKVLPSPDAGSGAPSVTPTPELEKPAGPIKIPVEDKLPVKKPVEKPVADKPADTPAADPIVAPKPVEPSPIADENPAGAECAVNGQIYCNGEAKFYICNFGKKVDMGAVAAGTKCVDGKIQRRNVVRFQSAHMRRRHAHGGMKHF